MSCRGFQDNFSNLLGEDLSQVINANQIQDN
jgi:hypothetical protein